MPVNSETLLPLLFLLFFSAVFSSSESALFSIPSFKVEQLGGEKSIIKKILHSLLTKPKDLLITIILGNMFVNIFLSSEVYRFFLFLKDEYYRHIVVVAVATPMLILFGEILPKLYGIKHSLSWSLIVSPFMYFVYLVLKPIVFIVDKVVSFLLSLFGIKDVHIKEEERLFLRSIRGILRRDREIHSPSSDYETLIQNIINFKDLEARHIMVPQNLTFFIPYNSTIEEARKLFLKSGYDRAPVYHQKHNNIKGILDYKKILPYLWGIRKAKTINRFLDKVYTFHEDTKVLELYKEFRDKGIKMAIVVDDFGGVSGIITFKDLTEAIFGKVYKRKNIGNINFLEDGKISLSGDFRLQELSRYIDIDISEYEAETIGGLIVEKLGYVPSEGSSFDNIIPGFILKVIKVSSGRILKVLIEAGK
jgi:CBS domain containing-hemolysin-like protein